MERLKNYDIKKEQFLIYKSMRRPLKDIKLQNFKDFSL